MQGRILLQKKKKILILLQGCNNLFLQGRNNLFLQGCNNLFLQGCNNLLLQGCIMLAPARVKYILYMQGKHFYSFCRREYNILLLQQGV